MHLLRTLFVSMVVIAVSLPAVAERNEAPKGRMKLPSLPRSGVGLFHAFSLSPREWARSWRQERALHALERAIHNDPQLEHRFFSEYGRQGGRGLWQDKKVMVGVTAGQAVNIGGFLQPDLLIPYFLAACVVDGFALGSHVVGSAWLRRKTTLSLLESGKIPPEIVERYAAEISDLMPKKRSR